MSVTVTVSIGHTRDAQGAVSACGKVTEFAYNLIVAKHLKRFLERSGVRTVVTIERSRAGISEMVRRIASHKPVCAVELHLNSSVARDANGTENLYAWNRAYSLAEMVQKRQVQAYGTTSRRLLERRTGNGSTYLLGLEGNGIPAIITEPFFMHNPREWARFKDEHELIAKGISNGVIDWLMASRTLLDRPTVNATLVPILPPTIR